MRRNLSGTHHRKWFHTFFNSPKRKLRGISLVETAVAVAVMSVLAVISVPALISQRTIGQDSVARSNVATAAHGALAYYTQHDIVTLPPTLEGLLTQLSTNEPALQFIAADSLVPDRISVARHSETLVVMAARSHSGRCVVAFANLRGPSFISNHDEVVCNAESFDYVYGYIPIQNTDDPDEVVPPPTTSPTTTTTLPPTTTTTLPPTTTTTTLPPTTTTTLPPTTTTTLPPTTTTTTLPPTTTTTLPPTTTTTLPPTTTTTLPPAPAGPFYEGYNMMAVGTGFCGVDIDLNNFSLEGGLHTNGYVNINANNGSISGSATAFGHVELNGTSFNGSFSYGNPIDAPLVWHPSQWAPGSARAAELDKNWHYWPNGMTITKKNQKIEKGVHYVNGDVHIALGQNLKIKGTTIIATGKINIEVNGPVELEAHTGEDLTLFAFSDGVESCDNVGINVDANSAKLNGVFYSPHDKVRLVAGATSNFTGNLIASAIEVGGNVLWMFSP